MAEVDHRAPRWVPLAIAAATFLVLLVTAPKGIGRTHTPFNHYALLADGWLAGRLDLGGEPPAYTQLNDFALYDEKFFVSFPPFPALILLPFVAIFGSADKTPDGLVFLLVAAFAPAVLYRALEALREVHASRRSWRENIVIAALLPLGTVFWFTAVQGTVWFAAHVVGVVLASAYLWASAGARRPALAGLFLVLAFATRPPLALAAPFFLMELVHRHGHVRFDRVAAAKKLGAFAAPIIVGLAILCAFNEARFDDPFEFGHRHLQVVWRARMDKWGLFSLHYLGKNLGVMLASTPFLGDKSAPFQITAHGLALWITSPFLLFALWPRPLTRRARAAYVALAISAGCIALVDLLYHNTGWVQFGYRFSNDFIVFLLAMLAIGRRRPGPAFGVLVAWSIAVNAFGALSFQRPGWEKYYRYDVRPHIYFEPD
ncbi:MAG: hypothetical protein HOW73_38570 [Polyangiaceae bacterium]|nr:hypothetical protein [Polyangiaceae bacterium]